jgi:ATP-dependent helicase HrpA
LEKRAEIVTAIRSHPVVIITGETGSGKTTQIPKMCLEAGRGLTGQIACTQPRRIAAATVAMRIAEELGEEIGHSVGYKIRFEDRTRPDAFIKVMTDGILLMEAQRDRRLHAYDTVIVDEAHERSLNIDFILGILKTILPKRRDLRIVITSATIDAQKFSRAFNDAPVIEVSGRLYPVEVRYRPVDPRLEESAEVTLVEAAVRTVEELVAQRQPGDVLVFMPTEQDIRETCSLLSGRLREQAAILPLFARLTAGGQQRVFRPAAGRKIIVATNIAETSITIPGIRFVVDTGLARISQYNPRSRTAGLPVRPISRSSAEQRKGRCGRVQNGICIRLYSEEDYLSRPPYTAPEILRANLAGVILRMLSLHLGEIEAFPFIDKPTAKSIRDGIEILLELGAIEPEHKEHRGPTHPWRLTHRGQLMARLPLDPRISRMILEARHQGCLAEIVVIAAALSIQDPRERPADQEAQADQAHRLFKDPASDFSALLTLWRHTFGPGRVAQSSGGLRRFCRDHFLAYRRMREWREIHDQIHQILREQGIAPEAGAAQTRQGAEFYAALHRSILSGYLGHIAVKKEKNLYTASQGRQAMLFPGSGLFGRGGAWIVAAELVETSRLFARIAANIDSVWLEELGGPLCRRSHSFPHWEKDRGEVVALEQVTLFGLTIVPERRISFGRIDPEAAAQIFVREALVAGEVKRPLPFLAHNRALIDRISSLEERIRRRDLLVSEEALASFYGQQLPQVYDIRTLQRLIRDRGGDAFLRMTEAELLARAPDPQEIALYPDAVSANGWRLECLYRFAPGQPEDGVTVKIPVQAVDSVQPEALDWAVPGLLRERILALLKGLPKEYRRQLLPLAGTAERILQEIKPEGALLNALGRFIHSRFGVDIPGDRWPVERLDGYLKPRLTVVDDKGRLLAAGRDPSILRQGFGRVSESRALAEARRKWEREGLTDWDFGDLPERITLSGQEPHAQVAFPALHDSETGIAIRLFASEREARTSHCLGLAALLSLRLREEIRQLRRAVSPTGNLKLWAAAFGGAKLLENAIVEKVLHDLFPEDIRKAAVFDSLLGAIRSRLFPRGQEVLSLATPPLKGLYETAEKLRGLEKANRFNRPVLAFLDDLRAEIGLLIPPDFLVRGDEERIGHLARYLRAIAIRAERGAVHLEKAIERGREIRELTAWHDEASQSLPPDASPEKRQALAEFRWLIEEYKISLFAQEIKTDGPISRKRIDARVAEIRRML